MVCGRAGADTWDSNGDEFDNDQSIREDYEELENTSAFRWTADLKAQFWEELQKLVILDVLMHNTDRG